MNKPIKGKLTCKGKVPEQLAAVGVDHALLHNTTIGGLDVDVSDLMREAAERVVDAVTDKTNKSGVSFSELLDKVNGEGYMDEWAKVAAAMATTALLGTAAQGWAFKNVVALAGGFDVDLFNSQASAKATAETESDFD